jgi:hypothetical protein
MLLKVKLHNPSLSFLQESPDLRATADLVSGVNRQVSVGEPQHRLVARKHFLSNEHKKTTQVRR